MNGIVTSLITLTLSASIVVGCAGNADDDPESGTSAITGTPENAANARAKEESAATAAKNLAYRESMYSAYRASTNSTIVPVDKHEYADGKFACIAVPAGSSLYSWNLQVEPYTQEFIVQSPRDADGRSTLSFYAFGCATSALATPFMTCANVSDDEAEPTRAQCGLPATAAGTGH